MPDALILFRVTWDERYQGRVVHKERITDSLTEMQALLTMLIINQNRCSNVKKQAAAVQWQDV